MRVYSPAEAAELLNISRTSLRKLTRAGEIGCVRLGAGTERIHPGYTDAHLAAFLAARDVPARGAARPAPAARASRSRKAATPASAAAVAAERVARAPKWQPSA